MEAFRVGRAVSDEYTARILAGTSKRPASALELSDLFDIPIAACYRRLRRLEEMGLIYCEGQVTSTNGKAIHLYRSRLQSVTVQLEHGRLRVRVELLPRDPENEPVDATDALEDELELNDRRA